MASSSRPRVEVEATLPGGFRDYYEQQGQSAGSTTETETTSSRSSDRPAPSKGILKPTKTRDSQAHLAARFYRVGKPEAMQHSPTYPPVSYGHDNSWHYDSYDNYDAESDYNHETDSQSASSELSVNTQATSVASDEIITDPGKRPSHFKHVRHVPPPTVARVKARPRTRPASTEVVKSQPQKRQVNIQIFPPGSSSQSQDLQLARKSERDLLDTITELERQADVLREARVQLSKELADATDKLSSRADEAKDLQKCVSHERNAKELLARELQEQRTMLDEYRSNFDLQKGMLVDAEKERHAFKKERDILANKASKLEQDMTTQETQHKSLEAALIHKVAELEQASTTLEVQITSQDEQLKDLTCQRESLQTKLDEQETQINTLKDLTKELDDMKCDLEKQTASYVEDIKKITSDRDSLATQLEEHQESMKEYKDLLSQRDSLKAEVEKLQEQVKTLSEEQATLKDAKKELETGQATLKGEKEGLETEIEELKEEIAELKGELEASKTKIEQLESDEEKLEEEIENVKKQSAELVEIEKAKLDEAQKQAESDKADLQLAVAGLKTDLEGAKDANVIIVSERLDIKTKYDSVSASLTAAQDEFKNLQDRNKTLESDIEVAMAKAKELEPKAEEVEKLTQLYKEAEVRANTLQSDINKRAEDDVELQATREKLAAEQAELDALRQTLEDGSAMEKLTEEKTALETRAKDLEGQVEALKTEETKLQTEVAGLKAEASKVPALTEQHQAVAAQLAAVTEELEQVRTARDAAAGHVRDLQAQVTKLQSRSKSRSGSRSKKHDRSRSTGLVFVRDSSNKGAGIYVTTREALKAAELS